MELFSRMRIGLSLNDSLSILNDTHLSNYDPSIRYIRHYGNTKISLFVL